jgi:hypothetical protein
MIPLEFLSLKTLMKGPYPTNASKGRLDAAAADRSRFQVVGQPDEANSFPSTLIPRKAETILEVTCGCSRQMMAEKDSNHVPPHKQQWHIEEAGFWSCHRVIQIANEEHRDLD